MLNAINGRKVPKTKIKKRKIVNSDRKPEQKDSEVNNKKKS